MIAADSDAPVRAPLSFLSASHEKSLQLRPGLRRREGEIMWEVPSGERQRIKAPESYTSSQQLDPGNKTSQHDGTSEGREEDFFFFFFFRCQRAERKLGNPSLGSFPWM